MKRILTAVLGLSILVFAACASKKPAEIKSDDKPVLTVVTSYYVSADGNDKNDGISEETPFKTLDKALEMASKSVVKKITVIGTLRGNASTEHLEPAIPRNIDKQTENDSIGTAQFHGDYKDQNPFEILITGKTGANGRERAVLTSAARPALAVLCSVIRLENIEVSGCKDGTVIVAYGDLTLGKGARITGNSSRVGSGVYVHRGTFIMCDDAQVTNNEGVDNVGIYLENGSVGVLLNNAIVADNKAKNNGGGIALSGSTLILKDNAIVTSNSAGNAGGGIITYTDKENGFFSQIIISDNARVEKNSAKTGGGILLQDKLILQDTARITENTASSEGGGVYGATDNVSVVKGGNVILSNNSAPNVPDINFSF